MQVFEKLIFLLIKFQLSFEIKNLVSQALTELSPVFQIDKRLDCNSAEKNVLFHVLSNLLLSSLLAEMVNDQFPTNFEVFSILSGNVISHLLNGVFEHVGISAGDLDVADLNDVGFLKRFDPRKIHLSIFDVHLRLPQEHRWVSRGHHEPMTYLPLEVLLLMNLFFTENLG